MDTTTVAASYLELNYSTSTLPVSMVAHDPFMRPPGQSVCRDRQGFFSPAIFKIWTCAMCFQFVYNDVDVRIVPNGQLFALLTGYNTAYPPGTPMIPDIDNRTASNYVCGALHDSGSCWRWKSCCRRAARCCDQQLQTENAKKPDEPYCPGTWDGFACFKDTRARHTVTFECPEYVNDLSNGDASKICTENGSWYTHGNSGMEWTDYSTCNDLGEYERIHTAAVACNVITIIFLVPACIIFFYFKPLRQQHRIRLHLCLMISSLAHSIFKLLWEIVIFRDRLHGSSGEDSVLYQNSVGCRVLNMVTRYSLTANFMWMFIEGFHLHRLLVHAFSAPKSLLPYYFVGFGFPWFPIAAYTITRGVMDELNQRCWSHQAGLYEWILYTPILAVLLVNVFFLLRIVFIMVKQLEPHPNEPSNFRRAAKAVGVLVPLFGVQFILFVYRPQGSTFAMVFELLNVIVSSLQGTFIAIIFCYNNKEVQGHLKTVFLRFLRRGGFRGQDLSMRGGSVTMTSQFTADACRTRNPNGSGDASHMIPLQRISESCDLDPDPSSAMDGQANLSNGMMRCDKGGDDNKSLLSSNRTSNPYQ